MTAEIAILNKTAVALAADSAVTISAGNKQDKVFDSADKLFELSDSNPVGIMIYNGMSFMEAPLPDIICAFRRKHCVPVRSIREIAQNFLAFLNSCGNNAPSSVRERSINEMFEPVLSIIRDEISNEFKSKVIDAVEPTEDPRGLFTKISYDVIKRFTLLFEATGDAQFIGKHDTQLSTLEETLLDQLVERYFPAFSPLQQGRLAALGKLMLRKDAFFGDYTGIVIAGFGSDDLFPSLVSYEIGGMIAGRLKFAERSKVSIDREGPKARVMPFAQKEMVERFLYGLDEGIERQISKFCQETVTDISREIIKNVEFDTENDRQALLDCAADAEGLFRKGLKIRAFDNIRSASRGDIEEMVEFMPKAELAKMAEALVNLTSIKRRVSRGMETVGGPIDVAVISQSEGFVWIKRKHYFTAELNARYLMRLNRPAEEYAEVGDGQTARSRNTRAAKKGKPNEKS